MSTNPCSPLELHARLLDRYLRLPGADPSEVAQLLGEFSRACLDDPAWRARFAPLGTTTIDLVNTPVLRVLAHVLLARVRYSTRRTAEALQWLLSMSDDLEKAVRIEAADMVKGVMEGKA